MIQQKNILITLSLLFSSCALTQDKTMFIPRLVSTDQVFELALTNNHFQNNRDTINHVFSMKGFLQKSNAGNELSQFFFPHNKTSIQVREDGNGDVNSLWLDLISTDSTYYSSDVCMNPQRSTSGVVFTWYFDLNPCVKHLWFGVNTALAHSSHALRLKEFNNQNPGVLPGFKSIYTALNNFEWCFGKFTGYPLTYFGLDDIQIKIGYDCIDSCEKHLSPYIVGTIPTGKRPNAQYIFEPLVGSKHGSLGIGLNGSFDLDDLVLIHFMFDAKYNYVFSSTECRSFDLCNGDWSRFLQVVTQTDPLFSVPGINAFTKPVRVWPGSTAQLWAAFNFDYESWQWEVGYNFWCRAKEKIALQSCCVHLPCSCEPIGILDMIRICNPPATTAHCAGICQSIVGSNLVVSDSEFTPTTISDFNLSSAINNFVFSNTLYFSGGYKSSCLPLLMALNGSYEFAGARGAISQYAIWGTVELEF